MSMIDIIGRQVKGRKEEVEFGTRFVVEDNEFLEEMKAKFGENTRIRAPGNIYEGGWNATRTTIDLDAEGVVTRVCYG